ncbi:ankyrin [Westerdykella ornata]|uniref:Ankyrin n=1 Tax=Westerdykella ornata TaxID=318751 RepID=A0A6A6JW28_WESOR|nr:ankyrin [Westerdykella ornata]KAF2280018.1 ankyrin [Westerdykella ornata]
MSVTLDEDAIDEILYLARANEAHELEEFLSNLSGQTQKSRTELISAAVDPSSKNTALHYAAANGHVDVLKLLLPSDSRKGTAPPSSPVNAINDAGNTPLHWAALNGRLDCVKLLVEAGADVTIINKAGHDAVFEAEINDKGDVVDWLLGAVEDLEKAVGNGSGSSAEQGEGDDMDVDETVTMKASTDGAAQQAETCGVDEVRKAMEGMDTNDGTSEGG